jgi:nitrite reductase (NADH) small subunit
MKRAVCALEDLEPGCLRAFQVGDVGIVVIRTPDGQVRALRDRCAHLGARLSQGRLAPMTISDEPGTRRLGSTNVILCPWHGFEFDVTTGRCPANPERIRVKTYDVLVEDGMIFVNR